jgi:hypothetical protein
MAEWLLAAARTLDAVGVGGWARGSGMVYPVANVAHVLGLAGLIGAIGILDLRIAGLWRDLPLDRLSRALTPIAIGGLAIMVASGLVLFAADGAALSESWVFRVKLVLIAVALANAALFRWRASGGAAARPLAILSVALWVTVAVAGRMNAYS